MKKILISITSILFISLTSISQDFFFVGENSYPCTETFTLQSNSDRPCVNDLSVLLGNDGSQALFLVSTETASTVRISEKLIIYLDDGTVISCVDKGINDNVDDIASSVYYLTDEELIKMKNSNINKVRYEIRCADCWQSPCEGTFSASNRGNSRTDFPAVIAEFFSED